MPQNPTPVFSITSINSALDVSAAKVIKSTPGRLAKVVVLTSATFTLNDCATTGAAATSNEIYTGSTVTPGTVLNFDWPCLVGITVGTISAGTISVSFY
jgi:hypothetical protein